ncbi:MAG: ribonuclease P protein component [Melioribacteraceae bacterium]|nr:MAG: ribonuclease P protein component [Melioribacteraceae bacterium]
MKRFGLSKKERIKQSKEIEKIYSVGKTCFAPSKKIKAIYLTEQSDCAVVKVAFAVSKRAGKAFWRNRVKRVLREAYRQNKSELLEIAASSGKSAFIIFSPVFLNQKKNSKVLLSDIERDVIFTLKKISGEL